MSNRIRRRDLLKLLGAGAATVAFAEPLAFSSDRDLRIAGTKARISVTPISRYTTRITILSAGGAPDATVPDDGALVLQESTRVATKEGLRVTSPHPLTFAIATAAGKTIQEVRVDSEKGDISFQLGDGPVFGLGEGGPQFDRRGDIDRMRSGQGGYQLRTHGGRVPIQWLIGTSGWAMFIHSPLGSFDLSGKEGRFIPPESGPLPIDLFVVDAANPQVVMKEYAGITGHPEMPPLWSLGYQQSHRTIASREEIVSEAKTFREKKLPCDALIYLGTGFCPSGWNTENGSFQFNHRVFDEPKEILDEFHSLNFKVALHAVILTRTLRGTVHDPCSLTRFDESAVSCYWDAHRKDFALGVDGWWPDEGDPLDPISRLTRIRMYYEGPQLDRPNERPYALHRNGYAGMQRYAPFLWSGDVYSTWETLRNHVPVGLNTSLSGIPLWGTDTGGFVPTKDLTGELYVRWFQFSTFCPLFRSHGRDWKLRLPWGWNTGELGPNELSNYGGGAANPDPSELHNAEVEPICRKYLELRYRLLPYTYTAVREGHDSGLPIMRALWLHYPDDPTAVGRGDEYLWGRDLLVAPVTEKAATAKAVYLPHGRWYDFWTEEPVEGGREVTRPVDLATIPIYAKAGAILPLGPVKQFTSEKVDAPLTLVIYPGENGAYTLYEDDGSSFDYRRGEFSKIEIKWQDATRQLSMRVAHGTRMAPSTSRKIEVRVAGEKSARSLHFTGQPVNLKL